MTTAVQAAGSPKGSVMTVAFELDGQEFTALNGGPVFTFTEAISLVVQLRDAGRGRPLLGEALARVVQEVQCGWLKDKFGVSWQVVPDGPARDVQDRDPEKAKRVMAAMLKMKKIDIDGLKRAYEGR